jgi:hypothetical protein
VRVRYLLAGAALVILGAILQIVWLGLCFGTIIVGVVLLIFAPLILFFPFTAMIIPGSALILAAIKPPQNRSQRQYKRDDVIDVEVVG